MKTRILILAVLAVGATLAWTNAARSGEEEGKKADPVAEMTKDQIKQMFEACHSTQNVSENHRRLERFVGEWNTEMKVWMMPDMPPETSSGTSKIKSVLGGRFIQEEFKSSMMGVPYEGIGMQGYNNARNVYEGTWTSSMDTHILYMVGTAQPDKDGNFNVFNFYGEMDEPLMNMYGRTVNYRVTVIDDNKHKFEIFDLAAGPDYKVIEITYTRK